MQEVKVKAEQREARGKGKRLSQVSGLKTSMSGEEGMKQSGEKKTEERIETREWRFNDDRRVGEGEKWRTFSNGSYLNQRAWISLCMQHWSHLW